MPLMPKIVVADTPEQAAFRKEVRSFLKENLPAGWMEAIDADDDSAYQNARAAWDMGSWMRLLGESGYVAPLLPKEYGGLGVGPIEQGIMRGAGPLPAAHGQPQHPGCRHGRAHHR